MDWNKVAGFAVKLPLVIRGTMTIVEKIKGADGKAKKDAVLESVPEAIAIAEYAAGKDLLNDPVIQELMSAYVDAEAAAMKAKAALQAGILAKQPAA